jgi:HEAT repeat protein
MCWGDSMHTVYLNSGAKDNLPALKKCLQDPDPGVRSLTAAALINARELEVKDHVAVQVQALKAADPWVRRHSALLGFRVGLNPDSPEARDAAAALTAALADQDAGVRTAAAEALKQFRKK